LAEKVRTERPAEKNTQRMRYPEFRRQGPFVGTGVIEAGCKTVIGSRSKPSGMFWTVRGAKPSWFSLLPIQRAVRALLGSAPGLS
jgi:hypothetical protein